MKYWIFSLSLFSFLFNQKANKTLLANWNRTFSICVSRDLNKHVVSCFSCQGEQANPFPEKEVHSFLQNNLHYTLLFNTLEFRIINWFKQSWDEMNGMFSLSSHSIALPHYNAHWSEGYFWNQARFCMISDLKAHKFLVLLFR